MYGVKVAPQLWNETLKDILKGYVVKGIFNIDKMRLVFKCTSDRTYTLKSNTCSHY